MFWRISTTIRGAAERSKSPLALAALIAFAAFAAFTPNAAAALEVTGRVVEVDGTPVAEARVALSRFLSVHESSLRILRRKPESDETRVVRTSADGRYRLLVPQPGMWQAEVSASGRIPMRCRLIPLLEDEALPDAVLDKGERFEVRIEDDEGSSIAGAQVLLEVIEDSALRSRRRVPSRWTVAGRYGQTGPDGRVVLARKASQKIRVRAFFSGFLPAESTGIDLATTTLRLRPAEPLTVRVRTSAGEPVADAALITPSFHWVAGSTDELGQARLFATPSAPLPLVLRRATGQIESTELLPPTKELIKQEGVASLEWRLPNPAVLVGRVVDSETREPLPGALVWSPGNPGEFDVSDLEGRYRLTQGSVEPWEVKAAARGYAPMRVEASAGPGGLRVPTLLLARAAAFKGRVVDPEGNAISGAVVRATGTGRLAMAFSEANGSFLLGGLKSGHSYELATGATRYAPNYRRETLQPDRDLEIVLYPGRSVAGRLVTPDQVAVAGARVYVVPIESDPRIRSFSTQTQRLAKTESDSFGRFRIDDLEQQTAALVARRDGLADKIVRNIDLTEDEELLDLGDLQMSRGVELSGSVRSHDDEGITAATLEISSNSSDRVLLGLRSEESHGRTVVTDDDGEFLIEGLSPNHTVNIIIEHADYVSRSISEVDPKNERSLEILLDRAARVSGRVLDDSLEPVASVHVTATTLRRETAFGDARDLSPSRADGLSDRDGSFEVEGIAPGEVEFSAQSGDGWIVRDTQSLDLSPGEERSGLVLRVSAGTELSGTVTNTEGSPVAGVFVSVANRSTTHRLGSEHSTWRSVGAPSDREGNFSVRGIDPETPQATVTARHPDYAALEQTLEVRTGTNHLDLVLGLGASLLGTVINEAGEPVGSAQIEGHTVSDSRFRQSYLVSSDRDGLFEIKGLPPGAFTVQARKRGYAESVPSEIQVNSGLQARTTLLLERGGTIRGRILGVEPHELGEFSVIATNDENGMATGLVGESGEYRIPNVGFGEGRVLASSELLEQSVTEHFSLEVDGGETWVDLDFDAGSSLTGSVLENGEPLALASVSAGNTGNTESSSGYSTTDAAGRFRIRGLVDGSHRLKVASDRGLNHTETVDIVGDTEITISIKSVIVSGRVVASQTRESIAGADVSATSDTGIPARYSAAHTRTNADGEFEFHLEANRVVLLRGAAEEFAEGTLAVATGSGGPVSALELALDSAEVLDMTVTLWSGLPADRVIVALTDASGKRILVEDIWSDPSGRFQIASAPPGVWTLLVAAQSSAVVTRGVTIPGPPIEISLPEGASVHVESPSQDGETSAATLRLLSPSGEALRLPVHGEILDKFPFYGQVQIPYVPVGDWIVEIVHPPDAVRRQPITTVAGQTVPVRFE